MEPDREDVKKKLEAIVGRELTVAHEQLIKLRFPVSAYDQATGAVVWHHLFLPNKSCEEASLLDVSGASSSGADGTRVVKLSDVACLGSIPSFQVAEPVNVLATARSVNPFFVTNTHSLISPSNPIDIEITFFVWDEKGQAAPNVSFDWRCRANVSPQPLPPLP
jgi:hypothetical protein